MAGESNCLFRCHPYWCPFDYLKSSRGLRQDDSVSPFLLTIMTKTFNCLLIWARDVNLFETLYVIEGDLQSGDFTNCDCKLHPLVFFKPNRVAMLNFRCVLLCFQPVFGEKVNLAKCKLVSVGNLGCNLNAEELATTLGYNLSNFHLGFSLGAYIRKASLWDPNMTKMDICLVG